MPEEKTWYLDDAFWRTFYPCMFNSEAFAEGEAQVAALPALLGFTPERVLDLGSGPGRHALPLARAGYRVTAVDTSAGLLQRLEQLAADDDLDIDIRRADMREFEEAGAFDAVLVMWTSFGYFSDEADHAAVLERIRDSLRDGGGLVLDLVGLEYLCRNLQPVHLTEYDDGRLLVERPVLTDDLTRLDNEWLLIDGDRVHRAEFSHRVWSADGIRHLLDACGFARVQLFGDLEGGGLDLDSERLIAVAWKA